MPDQMIASRYRILRELGRGGMGVVYVVEHTRTGDQLALKLLHGQAASDPQSIERFKREARAAARIKSDHVVKVVDADVAPELENAPFLVMELLDGQDLEKLREERGRLSPQDTLEYLSQAARALDKSHALGIVHRDLKPENIFLHRREDGSTIVKILDFGISKMVAGDGAGDMTGAGMTNTGAIMGTPLYMSPEQARGQVSSIGAATDVWAVGLIAIRLLTGEIYWRANTIAELMVQILAEPLYRPTSRWPWLPAGIDDWFARSCAREQSLRFRGVGQQVEALGVALGLRRSALAATVDSEEAAHPVQVFSAAVAPSPPAPLASAPRILGANTTTSRLGMGVTAPPGSPRSRTPLIAGVVSCVIVAVGAGVWVERGRWSAPRDGASLGAATASTSASPTIAPPAPAPPAASPSSASTATLMADAAASATASATARPRLAAPWTPAAPPASSRPTSAPVVPRPTAFAPVSP